MMRSVAFATTRRRLPVWRAALFFVSPQLLAPLSHYDYRVHSTGSWSAQKEKKAFSFRNLMAQSHGMVLHHPEVLCNAPNTRPHTGAVGWPEEHCREFLEPDAEKRSDLSASPKPQKSETTLSAPASLSLAAVADFRSGAAQSCQPPDAM
jgi:hypothetical protein